MLLRPGACLFCHKLGPGWPTGAAPPTLPALALGLGHCAAQGRDWAWAGLLLPPAAPGRCSGCGRPREQVEERLSFYETGEISQKNLDVMKEAMVQAEEAAAEFTRKLEKQEKKRLKKEKKRLAVIALASSENSSAPEECEETSERPKKKKKQKPQEVLQENGMEDPSKV